MEPAKFVSVVTGLFLMFLALAFQSVTMASGNYVGLLVMAALLALAADACVAWLASADRVGWRIAAFLVMSPTLYIALDTMRRLL